ncbi:MAG: hypothetical protein F4210_06315 [Holophagales bacterium]|nr:hypothetical protein [Holophagales bacterium]MYF95109.1 hypothetical protein [Holophagales bacterium]
MTPTSPLRRTVATLLPILILAGGIPALAIFGFGDIVLDPANLVENALTAGFQDLINDTIQNQLDHLEEKALGEIGKLTESFAELTGLPMPLLDNFDTLTWAGDFRGDPGQLLQNFASMQDPNADPLTDYWRQYLAQADTVSRQRYANTFRDVAGASDKWLAQREQADRARIFDYTALDSAERIIELLGNASDAVERSRGQTNLSDTALAQEQLANQITVAEIDMAVAELLAQTTVREAMDRQTLELQRRHQLEAWVTAERTEARQADRAQNRLRGQRNAWRQAFLLD